MARRSQRAWNWVKDRDEGGFPYSEGIYEDLNKAVFAQFYWDPDKSAAETIREYSRLNFPQILWQNSIPPSKTWKPGSSFGRKGN